MDWFGTRRRPTLVSCEHCNKLAGSWVRRVSCPAEQLSHLKELNYRISYLVTYPSFTWSLILWKNGVQERCWESYWGVRKTKEQKAYENDTNRSFMIVTPGKSTMTVIKLTTINLARYIGRQIRTQVWWKRQKEKGSLWRLWRRRENGIKMYTTWFMPLQKFLQMSVRDGPRTLCNDYLITSALGSLSVGLRARTKKLF
jgi:hypothetical protein